MEQKITFNNGSYAFVTASYNPNVSKYLDQLEYFWSLYSKDGDVLEREGPFYDRSDCLADLRGFAMRDARIRF